MQTIDAALCSTVVEKLIGRVDPVGDTNIDNERFLNILTLEALLDNQIDTMYAIARYSNSPYASMSRAGEEAVRWFEELADLCGDVLRECKHD